MATHYRKLLPQEPDKSDKKDASSCYMCYVCPEHCYISSPPHGLLQPSPSQKHHASTILILMLCVLGIAFFFLSYLTLYRYRSRRRNPIQNGGSRQDFIDENLGPVLDHPIWYIRTVGLNQSIIDSITAFKFKTGEGLIEGSECSVCLSELQEDEILRLLPKCSHAFHVNCIDTWLTSHQNCPVCRAPIVINNGSTLPSMEDNQELEEVEDDGNGSSQTGLEENEVALESRFRAESDLGDDLVKRDQESEPTKRSVSMDFSSSSIVYTKRDEGCSNSNLERVEEQGLDMVSKKKWLMKSSSYGRFIEKGPVSMKRSFSFSGKHSMRKSSRSLESISISIPQIV